MAHKDLEERRKYQREYQRKWRKENPKRIKEINKKSENRVERKEYLKNWKEENPEKVEDARKKHYHNGGKEKVKEWETRNPDKVRKKYKKYYSTSKGISNILRKKDRLRFGKYDESITDELVKQIILRDKDCCYCGKDIIRGEYDHINAFRLISKNNIARICSKCNQSKNNADLLQWMKWKKYKITQKILDLYNLAYY